MIYEELVKKALKKVVPLNLEIMGNDRRIYTIVLADLKHYLCIKWGMKDFDQQVFMTKFLDQVVNVKDGMEIKLFIDTWIASWYVKWKQRTKLIFQDEQWTVDKDQIMELIKKGGRLVTRKDMEDLVFPVISTLIAHGEIACTAILATNTIQIAMANRNVKLKDVEEKLNFLNLIMKKIASYSQTKGPLVFIKISKRYFR